MGLIKDLKKKCKEQATEIKWLGHQKAMLLNRRNQLEEEIAREQLRETQLESILGELFVRLGQKEVKIPYSAITDPKAYDLMVAKDNDTKELTIVMVKKEDNPS